VNSIPIPVFTTGKGTICDVVAVGKNQGNRLLAAYASVKNKLAREYGKPSDDLDFCKVPGTAVLIASLAQMPRPLTFHSNCG